MNKEQIKIALIQHGCDKNRVDSECILKNLQQNGFAITNDLQNCDVIIVNSCSFIKSARKECNQSLLLASKIKKKTNCKIVLIGCYVNKLFENDLAKFKFVDKIVPLQQNENLSSIIYSLFNVNCDTTKAYSLDNRLLSTPPNYAFLKIADGCNNFCSYCTIPYIRGRFASVPMDKVVEQAKHLCSLGISELILVAQDVTKYGFDLYGDCKIVELVEELSKIESLKWIRLLYCYPELVSDDLINCIASNKKVCKYIDVPLQHVSDSVLKHMNRKSHYNQIIELMSKLKQNNIYVRTTFMLGYPTETKKDFEILLNFIKQQKLERVGFFTYSKEKGTKSAKEKHQVPNIIKKIRLKRAKKIQNKILKQNNLQSVGKIVECVIENKIADNYYLARSEYDSPEIDTVIYVYSAKELQLYSYVQVKITNVINEDLEGEIL